MGQMIHESKRLRVVLADDRDEVLDTVERVLAGEFEVVGKVKDGQALLDASVEFEPDVLVVDITMPVVNGIEAVQRLKDSGSRAQVVFLTIHEAPEFVRAAFATGAGGFVVKRRIASDLADAIRKVYAGHSYVSPSISLEDPGIP